MKLIKTHQFENNSRILEIELNKKKVETPSYFPQIARIADARDFLNAIVILERGKEKPMNRIGGVIMEAHSTPKIMDKDLQLLRQVKLFKRQNGSSFSSFYDMLKEKSAVFLIDPNLDRFNLYKKDFKKVDDKFDRKLFTPEIRELLQNEGNLKDTRVLRNLEFVRRMLQFQKHYRADDLIAPYIAVDLQNFDETLETNKDLYERSLDARDKFFNEFDRPIATICIRKNMLKIANVKKEEMLDRLLGVYANLNADMYFFKISDFMTQSKDEEYDKILELFKKIKEKINKPIVFLNMNVFAYVLLREGLDGYSSRFGRSSSMDIPMKVTRTKEQIEETMSGYYYRPEKMRFVKKCDLKTLPCSCPFCIQYDGKNVSDIPDEEWKSLRLHHYLWVKNSEMEQLVMELKKNSLRAAIRDVFARSSEWTSFAHYS